MRTYLGKYLFNNICVILYHLFMKPTMWRAATIEFLLCQPDLHWNRAFYYAHKFICLSICSSTKWLVVCFRHAKAWSDTCFYTISHFTSHILKFALGLMFWHKGQLDKSPNYYKHQQRNLSSCFSNLKSSLFANGFSNSTCCCGVFFRFSCSFYLVLLHLVFVG